MTVPPCWSPAETIALARRYLEEMARDKDHLALMLAALGLDQPTRRYPAGHWRCPKHTPAAQAGHPEPPSTPMEPR
ncbi:hypothetical protein ACGF07_25705 [Kitasatospora sp. NPDC048194]|uniref:hypothetical protein n=1 Tax=Kitasatospora sp. NPDC048194 TaxID=3364045 RepID=UPI0037178941